MNYNKHQLIHWMDLVRTHPDALECFWPSQINSKAWITEKLEFTNRLKRGLPKFRGDPTFVRRGKGGSHLVAGRLKPTWCCTSIM